MSIIVWITAQIVNFLKKLTIHYKTFRHHGLFLPQGAFFLRPENIRLGKNFSLSPFCQLICQDPENGSELVIGNRVALNFGVHINADRGGKIRIGDNVIIGPMCILRAADHIFTHKNIPIRDQQSVPGVITIEDDVWLGGGVIVLKDVTIGRSSVIGAGSVVTRDIPPFSVAVGNPARVIRNRNGAPSLNSL